MSEPSKKPHPPDDSRPMVTMSIGELRQVIAEEVIAALRNGGEHVVEKDGAALLTPEKTAELMGVEVRWLYRHAKQLPFTRKLSRRVLRFSEAGLRKWLAAKRS
ncbi:MAG TPA: helix-turn-helix domain-containing protein [Candidatus Binatia bacterium]